MKDFLMSERLWHSVIFIAVCVAVWLIIRHFSNRILKKGRAESKRSANIKVLFNIIKYVLFIFAFLTLLQINGINVSSLITGLGVAGITVGFALQDILKDLIMGTNILWDDFFKAGDVVRYKNIEGIVIYFNMKVTKIRDIASGNIFTVCNRNISEIEKVSDWQSVVVPSPYDVPADKMRAVCKDVCERVSSVENVSSCEFLGTDEFAKSQINYKILIHCVPQEKYSVKRAALGIIQDVLAENEISIPFEQLDVHMVK